jgi:DNA-packaging protein gp3
MPAPLGHPPYPGCETGGRPRKYTTEYIENLADVLIEWLQDENNYWFKDFCIERKIDPDFMTIWAKENEKFAGAYKLAKSIQESRIFKGAMIDSFNASLSKFALMNCHGWTDKQETKVSGDSSNPLSFVLSQIDGKTKDLVSDE